jgi:hypothetical protein
MALIDLVPEAAEVPEEWAWRLHLVADSARIAGGLDRI